MTAPSERPEFRAPPHSVQAEQGVLSSMLKSRDAIEEARAKATMESFFIPAHQILFGTILNIHGAGGSVDFITYTQALADGGMLESVGGTIDGEAGPGAWYVTKLFTFVPTAALVNDYLEIVRDKYILRQLIAISTEMARRSHEEQDDPSLLMDEMVGRLIEVGQSADFAESLKPIGDTVPEALEQLEATYRNRGNPKGISTGFADLDRMVGGWQPSKTYVIAARPAMGKTSLALEFAEYAAIDAAEKNTTVAVFSLEMTTIELAEVVLCRRAGIDLKKLRTGFFSDEQRAELQIQAEQVVKSRILIDDKPALSIFEWRSRFRRAVIKHGAKLGIIDYVQLMRSTSKRAQGNRELEISEIMQGIRTTAKELKVPVIVLAQLNRDVEKRGIEGIPQLSDLRESGSIEQEADLVALLYRPSYYAKSEERASQWAMKREMTLEEFQQLAELIIAKQRRGPVGTVPLRFIKELAHFEAEDTERPLYSNDPGSRQRR